jgi:vacuolar-type H+-ATPase subunit E/Vma4
VDEIARAQQEIIDQSRPLFREAHREWERFFAMLDREQERRARALVRRKLDKLERLGERLRGLLGEAFR